MNSPLSINEAVDRLDELNGKPVEIEGLLLFEFESDSIWHWPKAEQRGDRYQSSLALVFGNGGLEPNRELLARWSGKRVCISGILYRGSSPVGCVMGLGQGGLWPGEILPYTIELLKTLNRADAF